MSTGRMKGIVALAAFLVSCACAAASEEAGALSVCRELQARYRDLARANEARDIAAVQAIRTPDFSTIGPDGRRNSPADMEAYSRRLFESIRPPIRIENTILSLAIDGDTAVVDVLQEFSRRLLVNEVERAVETSVIQKETWRRMPDGWRIAFVSDVHDGRRFVDGKRVEPGQPYDPEAPPFSPVDPPRPEKTPDCGLPK